MYTNNNSKPTFNPGPGIPGLRKYIMFDWNAFAKTKEFTLVSTKPWLDYATKQPLGERVDVVITADSDTYPPKANGETVTSLYRQLSFKSKSKPNVKPGDKVVPVNPEVKPWGQYLDHLTIICDNVVLASPQSQGKKD